MNRQRVLNPDPDQVVHIRVGARPVTLVVRNRVKDAVNASVTRIEGGKETAGLLVLGRVGATWTVVTIDPGAQILRVNLAS